MKYKLKKELGLLQATFAGLGIILGAGIYALLGKAAGVAGNSVWLSFLISAIIAAFTGLSYAELSSMYPRDASEEEYAERAFNKRIGFLVSWLVIFQGLVSAAAVALGFAGYLSELFKDLITIPLIIGAVASIILFSIVNYRGIKESSTFNIIGTIIEGFGLFLIIFLGLNYFGSVNYLEFTMGVPGTISAASLIFFAFIGFQSIVKLSEETKNAKETIPKALVYSIIISTILYVLVAISAVSIMGWEKLSQSTAPLADVASVVLGNNAFLLLAIIAIFSTANTVLMTLVTISRIMYGVGTKFKKLKFLSRVHGETRTPFIAILASMIIALIFVFIGDIQIVAEITNFLIFCVFIIVNASLLILRFKDDRKRSFRSPLNIGKINLLAIFGLISTTVLIFYLTRNFQVYFGGIIIILIGIFVYDLIKE